MKTRKNEPQRPHTVTHHHLELLANPKAIIKGQLISKRLLEKIVWTKIAMKKFDNFCPGGRIKKKGTFLYQLWGI